MAFKQIGKKIYNAVYNPKYLERNKYVLGMITGGCIGCTVQYCYMADQHSQIYRRMRTLLAEMEQREKIVLAETEKKAVQDMLALQLEYNAFMQKQIEYNQKQRKWFF